MCPLYVLTRKKKMMVRQKNIGVKVNLQTPLFFFFFFFFFFFDWSFHEGLDEHHLLLAMRGH